tara:strand:+ start:629 stop:1378 length:750 start_codon:yes stop_codon:yes gene_type:complete
MSKNSSSGNALFLILIAVALFAALSYAVTQSGRGGGSIDREQASLAGAQLSSYVASMANAVTRMRLVSGCTESDFSFNYDSDGDGDYIDTDDTYNNNGAPGDYSCHIYHSNGGGITRIDPAQINGLTDGASSIEVYGTGMIAGAGTDGHVAESTDLALFIRNLTEDACLAISLGTGLDKIYIDSGDLNAFPFTGTYSFNDAVDGCWESTAGNCASYPDDSPWGAIGSPNGCFQEQSTLNYIYFHALLGR